MILRNTPIKSVFSTVAVASALALGGGAAAAAPTLGTGQTSVDSGIIGDSGSNHGMHPAAQGSGRFNDFGTVAGNRSTAGQGSIDSAVIGERISNQGITPSTADSNVHQERAESWTDQPTDNAAGSGDDVSNHGMTPEAADANVYQQRAESWTDRPVDDNANQQGSDIRQPVTVNHTNRTEG